MNSAKTNEDKPKLYIIQPSLDEPSRDMQSIYYSRNDTDSKEIDDPRLEETEDEENFDKKQFNDMTIEEKALYFSSIPFQAPKMKSEIITHNRSFIGIIQNYQNATVMAIVANKTEPISIPIDQIKEINLVGF